VYFVFFHTADLSYYCNTHGVVDLMGLKPNPYDPMFLQSFDTVG